MTGEMPRAGTSDGLVPSVVRATAILDLLASRETSLTLDEITRTLALPKSSTLAICRTLVARQLVFRDDAGRYKMGIGVVELARVFLNRLDIVEAFEAVLDARPRPPETTQLAVLRGTEVLYLARHDGAQPVRLSSNVGSRLPATTTAVGKAMLACLDNVAIQSLFAGAALPRLTDQSLRTIDDLLADLARTRDRGYSLDVEETLDGVVCVAAAIQGRRSSLPLGAVSASLPRSGNPNIHLSEATSLVQDIAADMSRLLAGNLNGVKTSADM